MKDFILQKLSQLINGYTVCGMVDRRGRIYSLSSDTKVISAIFEIITKQSVATYAHKVGLKLHEPSKQNHYLDFTLMKNDKDKSKIAIDVKTTYIKIREDKFSYTLGSYTSYINPESESKNIAYPYSDYKEHWIIGFVYKRTIEKRTIDPRIYSFDDLGKIRLPFNDVRVFVQEKWKIASNKAGSGNTTNIGSIKGSLPDFIEGKGVFESEQEFLKYWQGYKKPSKNEIYHIQMLMNFGEWRNHN